MFGKTNTTQNKTDNTDDSPIDMSAIRTLSSFSQNTPKNSPQKKPTKNQEPIVQRNFSQSEEEEKKKQPKIPENSPFFSPNQAVNNTSNQEEVTISKNIKTGTAFPAKKTTDRAVEHMSVAEIPREEIRQKKSFQPITSNRSVSENALSQSLSVENYTGRDGSGATRTKQNHKKTLQGNLIKALFVFLVLVLIILITWGGYTYWKSRTISITTEEETPIFVSDPSTSIEAPITDTDTFPYDWNLSNTLILDDTLGKDTTSEIVTAVENFSSYEKDGVLEFYFAESANDFEILPSQSLADRMGLNLPEALRSLLKDTGKGRFYLTKKGSEVHFVLALEITSRDAAVAELLKVEPELVSIFSPIYVGKEITLAPANFQDQAYREYALRYYNIDLSKNISLDYSFRRDTLLIASGKDALRDTLDFLDGKSRNSEENK